MAKLMPWAKFESYSFVCIIDSDVWNKLMMIKYRIIQFNSGLQDANLLKYLITYNPVNSRDVNHLQNLFLWDILIESFIFYCVLDVSCLATCFAVILSKCTVHCTYFPAPLLPSFAHARTTIKIIETDLVHTGWAHKSERFLEVGVAFK